MQMGLLEKIREAAFTLAPWWVGRWAPICTCNGMSVRDFIGDLRKVASGDLTVSLCPDTARRLADMLEPLCALDYCTTTGSSATVTIVGRPNIERQFLPISQ
jgi:hypothetical protein